MPQHHDGAPIGGRARDPAAGGRSGARAVPRVEVLETRCLMAGSASTGAPAVPVTAPPPYVIVGETPAPHGTLGTAQTLPGVRYFGVIGSLGAGDAVDVYRLPVARGFTSIEFELVSFVAAVPLSFEVYSPSGQLVGQWTTGEQSGSQYLDIQISGLPGDSAVFLGVSAAGPAPNGAAGAYQLWVSRDPTSTPAPGDANAPSAATIATPFSPLLSSTAATAPVPARGGSAVVGALDRPSGLRPAVGAFPVRSAGPLAGWRGTDGDPTPPGLRLAQENNAASPVDGLVATALPPGAPAADADRRRADKPEVLVALRGPGGAPLLGAATIGHRGVAAHPSNAPLDAEWPVVEAGDDPDRVDAAAVATDDAPSAILASLDAPRGVRASISSGLGLAIALTLNAVFSDPAAGFDSLASRLEPAPRSRTHAGDSDEDGGGV